MIVVYDGPAVGETYIWGLTTSKGDREGRGLLHVLSIHHRDVTYEFNEWDKPMKRGTMVLGEFVNAVIQGYWRLLTPTYPEVDDGQ